MLDENMLQTETILELQDTRDQLRERVRQALIRKNEDGAAAVALERQWPLYVTEREQLQRNIKALEERVRRLEEGE